MASTSLTTFDALLKTLYPQEKIYNMAYDSNPFFAMVPKNEKFTGANKAVPIHYGNTNKHSQTFTTAQGGSGTSQTDKFIVTRERIYAIADLDRETLLASKDDKGAFMDHFKFEVDDTIHAATRQAAIHLYGSGSGSVGQISAGSTVGSDTITLASIGDITNFEVGENIVLSATDGGGSLRNTGDTATITEIDRDAGTLTFAGNLTAEIAAAAASDYIFKEGYWSATGSVFKGLAGWLPATAPTATAFFGVDRSVDTTRLGGVRYDASATGEPVEESLLKLASRIGREGGRPDYCFVSFSSWEDLANSLQTSQRFTGNTVKSEAGVAFSSITIIGPTGPIEVIPDVNCPDNRAYMLTMRTWEFCSLKPAPHIFDEDGEMIRKGTTDSYEIRVGLYANLLCRAPGKNGVVSLA